MSLRDKYIEKCQNALKVHLRAMYMMQDVECGGGMFNYSCFHNAVQSALDNNVKVYECIYIDNGWPYLHYVNRDSDGVFVDHTLGYQASRLEYYIIREINPKDYMRIAEEFTRSQKEWTRMFTSKFWNSFYGVYKLV